MAENDPIIETPAPGEPTQVVDDYSDLKAFMGTAYKEGLTLAEVSQFLKGKKYADLNSGNYVSKGKYESLEKKHNEYLELTKDYENLKTENAGYKTKERNATLSKQAEAANIDSQFIEFALTQIDVNAQDTEKALKKWAKEHPQFLKSPDIIINTNPSHESGRKPGQSMNATINANLRAAAGKSQL